MGWEEMFTRSVPCPCGKGKISQTEYGDDWNRFQSGPVVIECDECRNLYKVDSDSYGSYKPKHGSWTIYYLLPIDYPRYSGITECNVYPIHNIYDISFHAYLIENYSKNTLIAAEKEYWLKKSSSKVTGAASSICKEHKRRFNTVKFQLVLDQIKLAIHKYDSYTGTYEQRQEIRELEKVQRQEYNAEKEKHRIKIEL